MTDLRDAPTTHQMDEKGNTAEAQGGARTCARGSDTARFQPLSPGSALRLAGLSGHPAVLCHRPHGVTHVYVGPLTRSGGAVPRARRPLCGTRTRVLRVAEAPQLTYPELGRPLCRRCSVCLTREGGQTEPVSRDGWVAAHGGLTPFDLALGAVMAVTEAEVQRCEYLALLLLELPDARTRVVRRVPGCSTDQPLIFHFTAARARVGGRHHNEWLTQIEHANRAATDATVKARKEARRAAHQKKADVFADFSRN